MRRRLPAEEPRAAALLGLAFDADDGLKRITRGRNFFLAGGSVESHGVMREVAVKLNERLDGEGRQLSDVSIQELREIVAEIRS